MATEFNKDLRGTKETTLPSTGAKLTLYTDVLMDHIRKSVKTNPEDTDPTTVATYLIKSWDFVKDGEEVEITEDNLAKLPSRDFKHIIDESGLQEIMENLEDGPATIPNGN